MEINKLKYLSEFISTQEKDEFVRKFSKYIKGDYKSFVSVLKTLIKDEKVKNFLKYGVDSHKNRNKFSVTITQARCSNLIPTQNEIAVDKSLDWVLQNPTIMQQYLSDNVIMVGNTPIVTFNNKYIIDGHHRWSQVYCVNPDARLKVVNFSKDCDAFEMLKAAQLAIGLTTGEIITKAVESKDLLNISTSDLVHYINEKISEEVQRIFGTKKQAIRILVNNCLRLRKENYPISNAPDREYMPQMNEPNGNLKNVISVLKKGDVKFFEKKIYKKDSKFLLEKATVTNKHKEELFLQIRKELIKSGIREVKDNDIKSFIDYKFSLNEAIIFSNVRNNFTDFVNKKTNNINESIKKIITEDEEIAETLPIDLFKYISDLNSDLADNYNSLETYIQTLIRDEKTRSGLIVLQNDIKDAMSKTTQLLNIIGRTISN